MSTETQHFQQPQRPGLIRTGTIARSIAEEWKTRRVTPEDLRTRRFGYNPGFNMVMDSVHTGLQNSLIEPGVLILFESGNISRQNWDVDPESNKPPDQTVELQAGEGLGNIYIQNAHMGWREVRPLRGMTDEEASEIFYTAHPPLVELVQNKLIEPCRYNLEVCITCRKNALNALAGGLPGVAKDTHAVLTESVTVGHAYMASQWSAWIGEIAESGNVNRSRMALTQLQEGHFFFMRQLHQETPSDRELTRMRLQNEAQADVLREAMNVNRDMMREMFAASSNPQVQALQEQNALLLARLEAIEQRQSAKSKEPSTDTKES
jgi:hypothetical protein